MNISTLTDLISVSGQVMPDQVEQLKALGVSVLVCNRPDNEELGQPAFAELQKKCSEFGMEAVYIPFSPGAMTESDISKFKEVLAKGARTHAFCRSGARSRGLWEACRG